MEKYKIDNAQYEIELALFFLCFSQYRFFFLVLPWFDLFSLHRTSTHVFTYTFINKAG